MHKELVDRLYLEFQKKGFLTEEEIRIELKRANVSIIQFSRIAKALFSKGILLSKKTSKNEAVAIKDRARLDYKEIYNRIVESEPLLQPLVSYVKKIAPPQRQEIDTLIPQINSGNEHARNRLFEMNMRVALKAAYQKYVDEHLILSDTVQDALIGLWNAIHKFDNYKHDSFLSYSNIWIDANIDRSKKIGQSFWEIPANKLKNYEKIFRYLKRKGFSFDDISFDMDELIKEIGIALNISLDEVGELLPLFVPILEYNDTMISVDDDNIADIYESDEKRKILRGFSEKERIIIDMYYFSDRTYNEIAEILNVSRQRVKQMHDRIKAKLVDRIKHNGNFSAS